MTKTLSMVSHKNYNLGANEGFVIFLTSKSNTCYIDGFTSKMKSQSIAYLLNGSEHIYWILDLEDEVHSVWVIRTRSLQECKGIFFFFRESGGARNGFQLGSENFRFVLWGNLEVLDRGPRPLSTSPWKFVGGGVECAVWKSLKDNQERLVLQ